MTKKAAAAKKPAAKPAKAKKEAEAKAPAPKKEKAAKASKVKKEDGETPKKKGKGKAKGTESNAASEDEESAEYKWWQDQNSLDKSEKWKFLEHNGVYFPPDYVPHGIKMKYKGESDAFLAAFS